MSITKKVKKAVAGVGAASLLTLGMFAAAPSALAQDGPGPDQPGHPTTGTLIINKRVGAEGAAGDGTVIDNPTGEPLAGVTFTYWQVGVMTGGTCVALDTSQVADWEYINNSLVAPADKPEGTAEGELCVVDPVAGTATAATDAQGVTTVSNLPLGFYYVKETAAPANVISKTAPFYVSIPMPNPDYGTVTGAQAWLYTVNVYPKNLEAEGPKKTINTDDQQIADGNLQVGDTVTWTIDQVVPTLKAGDTYTSAKIFDTFKDAELSYVADSSVVTLGGVTLTENVDYTVSTAAGTEAGTTTVTWELTNPTGLGQLVGGETLSVTFDTTVNMVTSTGAINNAPYQEEPGKPGYGSQFNDTPLPGTTTPYTYWGQLVVNKVDGQNAPLANAKFSVGLPDANGTCPADAPANPVATGTSNANGVVEWGTDKVTPLGLFIANSPNGELDNPTRNYCLYETEAPAGYTASTAPQTVTIKAGTVNVNSIDVLNVERDVPNLPLTGAQGTLLLTVLGLGLFGVGAGVVAVSRRKQQAR
ncbi:MAG: SpaH/EbpB family LPXTG-anchored major pilin [Arcanobacterium sp.]